MPIGCEGLVGPFKQRMRGDGSVLKLLYSVQACGEHVASLGVLFSRVGRGKAYWKVMCQQWVRISMVLGRSVATVWNCIDGRAGSRRWDNGIVATWTTRLLCTIFNTMLNDKN